MNRLVKYDADEGNTYLCLDCGKEVFFETDILLCEDCIKRYDIERLWKMITMSWML